MPRRNYGNAVKQRTLRFFTLLLDFANDELEGDESGLENLQRSIQINWQSDRQLIVRTKVRYLEDVWKYGYKLFLIPIIGLSTLKSLLKRASFTLVVRD
jgi:hypothetical protein